MKRRLSSHWKWNDRPLEARDLIICGIKNLSLDYSLIMPGISRQPRIEAVPYGQVATCPLPPCQLRIMYPALSLGRFKDLFRSISGRNHHILKIRRPPFLNPLIAINERTGRDLSVRVALNNVSRAILGQIQRSLQIHLRQKSSYPENIPSRGGPFHPISLLLPLHLKFLLNKIQSKDCSIP